MTGVNSSNMWTLLMLLAALAVLIPMVVWVAYKRTEPSAASAPGEVVQAAVAVPAGAPEPANGVRHGEVSGMASGPRIVVSHRSLASDDPHDLIASNIDFVNQLRAAGINVPHTAANSMVSYYLDYYLAQVNNGRFAQFVANSGWSGPVRAYVLDGLLAIGATTHVEVFLAGSAIVERLPPDVMHAFMTGPFFGDNPTRDAINEVMEAFYAAGSVDDLRIDHANWLRTRPELVAMSEGQMKDEVHRRLAGLVDPGQRFGARALGALDPYVRDAFAAVAYVDEEGVEERRGDIRSEHIPALAEAYFDLHTWGQRITFAHLVRSHDHTALKPVWRHLLAYPYAFDEGGGAHVSLANVVARLDATPARLDRYLGSESATLERMAEHQRRHTGGAL